MNERIEEYKAEEVLKRLMSKDSTKFSDRGLVNEARVIRETNSLSSLNSFQSDEKEEGELEYKAPEADIQPNYEMLWGEVTETEIPCSENFFAREPFEDEEKGLRKLPEECSFVQNVQALSEIEHEQNSIDETSNVIIEETQRKTSEVQNWSRYKR